MAALRRQSRLVQAPAPALRPPTTPVGDAPAAGWITAAWARQADEGVITRLAEAEAAGLLNVASDVTRLLQLPVLPPPAEGVSRCPDPDQLSRMLLLPEREDQSFQLRPTQLDAIWTYLTFGGVFGPIGVGAGKTLIAICCAILAIRSRGHYRAVILLPPEVFGQFVQTDLPRARKVINFHGVVVHTVHGSAEKRKRTAENTGPGVWVYSYSMLSAKNGYAELLSIKATCYICDEAHNVCRATTTRTKRLRTIWREIENNEVQLTRARTGVKITGVELVALSGTMTKKTVADYAHLAQMALKDASPVPILAAAVQAFSRILGADGGGGGIAWIQDDPDLQQVYRLMQWGIDNGVNFTPKRREDESDEEYDERCSESSQVSTRLRVAYQHRLHTAGGVIATSDMGVSSSLHIRWISAHRSADHHEASGDEMREKLMAQVVVDQKTPNGDVIEYGMHSFKWLWELSNGFYNSLRWPTIPEVRDNYIRQFGKDITDDEADLLLTQSKDHHQDMQQYYKALRGFLDRWHVPGCDTPMSVALHINGVLKGEANTYGLPKNLIDLYAEAKSSGLQTYHDLPQRISSVVRVSGYKIEIARLWAAEAEDGIIWYHHPTIGDWIHEALQLANIPHTYAKAGNNTAAFAEGIVVASFAHGTGKNLQHQHRNLFVEMRREAHIMEQTLGRTHRSGQKADVVEADIVAVTNFDVAMFSATLRDAEYAQSTLGQKQRLCYASYDPPLPAVDRGLLVRLGLIKPGQTIEQGGGAAWGRSTGKAIILPADAERIGKRITLANISEQKSC